MSGLHLEGNMEKIDLNQPENMSYGSTLTDNNITKENKRLHENWFKKASKISLKEGGKVQW